MGILSIWVVSFTFFTSGCNSASNEAYFLRLDTLDNKLTETREFLSIDVATIHSRNELIFNHLSYVDQFYKGEMPEEFGNGLAKYKGIKKNYAHFLKEYEKQFNEMKSLEKQAADLRKAVENKELSKEKFKEYYATELHDVEANRRDAEILNKTIMSLEPDYQRLSKMINDELVRLSLENPKLKAYLEDSNQEADTTR